jgi:hypothetical protein
MADLRLRPVGLCRCGVGLGSRGFFFSLFNFDLVWVISISLFAFLLNE